MKTSKLAYAIMMLGLVAMVTGFARAQNVADRRSPGERLAEVCISRGNDDAVCQCLIREAGSRFDLPHLAVVASAAVRGESVSEIGTGLSNAGYRESEIRSFLARIQSADTVISQTCGVRLING